MAHIRQWNQFIKGIIFNALLIGSVWTVICFYYHTIILLWSLIDEATFEMWIFRSRDSSKVTPNVFIDFTTSISSPLNFMTNSLLLRIMAFFDLSNLLLLYDHLKNIKLFNFSSYDVITLSINFFLIYKSCFSLCLLQPKLGGHA